MISRYFRKAPDDLLRIGKSYDKYGVLFDISVSMTPGIYDPLSFPITQEFLPASVLLRQKSLPKLSTLQELWMNSVLEDSFTEGRYFINFRQIDFLSENMRDILEIPKREPVEVHVESHLAVGNSDFSISASVTHHRHGRIPINRRHGEAMQVSKGDFILVDPGVAKLIDRIEDRPNSIEEQFPYVAEVKSLANKVGAELDIYLQREEYFFPTDIDVNVKAEAPDRIVLSPEIKGLPFEFNLQELSSGYSSRHGAKGIRHRVFLAPDMKENLDALIENSTVEGAKVPQFLHNPITFLPETLEIDLDKFSARVKGLGVRAYKAKPYIQVTPRSNGWFDIRVGVRKTDFHDEIPNSSFAEELAEISEIDANLSSETLANLADKAPLGGGWVLEGEQWVHVPKDAKKFVEASRILSELAPDGRVSSNHMRYILEIYTNIEELEYDSEFNRLARELLDSAPKPIDSIVPSCFNGKLYDYQTDGYAWMRRISRIPVGGLLADEMGLGKTVQVIAFMAWLFEQRLLRPSLVVGPQALVDNWEAEINRFLPGVAVYSHAGCNRVRDLEWIRSYDIVLTTYDTLVRDEMLLGQVNWNVCVSDEAQRIKNFTTSTARVVKALKAKFRLALTGTPVENSLGDLWSIVDYVQPGLLGSYQEFRHRFELPLSKDTSEETRRKVEKDLIAHLFLVYKRRSKDEFLKDLPPKEEVRHYVPLGHLQYQLYQKIIVEVLGGTKGRGAALGAIRRLLNVCAHPYLETGGFDSANPRELERSCPKLSYVLNILRKVKASGEKVLVFTDRRDMQRILVRVVLSSFGFMPIVINGDSIKRLDSVKSFNRSLGFNVMVLSPRAAGTGLTITGANHVIHYTRWWNPAVENQATDRVHRIGQTKKTFVYLPISTSEAGLTAEQVLDNLLREKRKIADSVIVPSNKLNVTEEEIAGALGLSNRSRRVSEA